MPDRDEFFKVTRLARTVVETLEDGLGEGGFCDAPLEQFVRKIWRVAGGVGGVLGPILDLLSAAQGPQQSLAFLRDEDATLDAIDRLARAEGRTALDLIVARSAERAVLAGRWGAPALCQDLVLDVVEAFAVEARGGLLGRPEVRKPDDRDPGPSWSPRDALAQRNAWRELARPTARWFGQQLLANPAARHLKGQTSKQATGDLMSMNLS